MIGVAVSENQVLELFWRTGKSTNGLKGGCLLIWKTGVDQRQPVVVLDQVGVCHPHRDDVHAVNTSSMPMDGTPRIDLQRKNARCGLSVPGTSPASSNVHA
jgi:hypothetical protein